MSERVLVVCRMDGTPVREIAVTGSDAQVERTLMGLLRNMNTDEFYVDDSRAYADNTESAVTN